jgi:putative multicomponent Na+:H+ antiporter subunit B
MTSSLVIDGELDLLLPITALFPLCAILLVTQSNPYQTLVLRGILGSVATLVYALLGAPDVALTEAMVGTLLSTTLYAVALRSSMALRLVDRRPSPALNPESTVDRQLGEWFAGLHLRLRFVSSETAAHGWLEAERRLVVRRPALLQRLQASPGYQRWLEAGGELVMAEPVQP